MSTPSSTSAGGVLPILPAPVLGSAGPAATSTAGLKPSASLGTAADVSGGAVQEAVAKFSSAGGIFEGLWLLPAEAAAEEEEEEEETTEEEETAASAAAGVDVEGSALEAAAPAAGVGGVLESHVTGDTVDVLLEDNETTMAKQQQGVGKAPGAKPEVRGEVLLCVGIRVQKLAGVKTRGCIAMLY